MREAIEDIVVDTSLHPVEASFNILNIFDTQRQKDLKKLSHHLGVPVDVLEEYLRSKDDH